MVIKKTCIVGIRVVVFNATYNSISVILWWSVLLEGKPEYAEKTNDLPQVTVKLYHIMLISSTHGHEWDLKSQLQW